MAFIPPLAGVAGAAAATGTAAAAGGTLLGTLGTALAVGGSLYSGYSAMQQGNFEAKLANYNAGIFEDNARRAIQRSQVEQQDLDNESAAMMGEAIAAQGASGLSLGGRSAILTRKAMAELNRKDALNIRQAAELERENYQRQAAGQRLEGQMAKRAGKAKMIASLFEAGTSLIGGANPTAKSKMFAPKPVPRPVAY